jgi:hypothetical protein
MPGYVWEVGQVEFSRSRLSKVRQTNVTNSVAAKCWFGDIYIRGEGGFNTPECALHRTH